MVQNNFWGAQRFLTMKSWVPRGSQTKAIYEKPKFFQLPKDKINVICLWHQGASRTQPWLPSLWKKGPIIQTQSASYLNHFVSASRGNPIPLLVMPVNGKCWSIVPHEWVNRRAWLPAIPQLKMNKQHFISIWHSLLNSSCMGLDQAVTLLLTVEGRK